MGGVSLDPASIMTLIFLTLALVGPYILLTVAARLLPAARFSRRARAKVGLSLMLLLTASAHFVQPQAMVEMLPPWLPLRLEAIYLTGFFEILGAIGIWVPGVIRLTGLCLILMLVGVLPSNVYAALNHVPFGGHSLGPAYLMVRLPFQVLLIGWIYAATGQHWSWVAQTLAGQLPRPSATHHR